MSIHDVCGVTDGLSSNFYYQCILVQRSADQVLGLNSPCNKVCQNCHFGVSFQNISGIH